MVAACTAGKGIGMVSSIVCRVQKIDVKKINVAAIVLKCKVL